MRTAAALPGIALAVLACVRPQGPAPRAAPAFATTAEALDCAEAALREMGFQSSGVSTDPMTGDRPGRYRNKVVAVWVNQFADQWNYVVATVVPVRGGDGGVALSASAYTQGRQGDAKPITAEAERGRLAVAQRCGADR